MIPIRDDTPRYSTPYITYLLIALNTVIFLFEVSLTGPQREAFVYQFGVEPTRILASLGLANIYVPHASAMPLFTSMFLHASWLHLIGNMWVLWIFGDNIEDYLGHFSYLVFYIVSGLAASIAHVILNADSNVPSVGASGAIAGVMGAYFLLFPSARVLTLVPLIIFFTFIWLPAWIVLGYWFVLQFLSGAATSIAYSSRTGGGGIAFWAHVGGFLAGVIMIKLMPQRMHRSRYSY
ncbi:MAG: rhomboid family intramembrane serine protease [Acidobacteria bacterium]|nr:rhomboid family intramembrane serine protease [Acidobacteriota bacterium]MBV9146246.1 rhomboid family intramembrane serine protease [Acidobacteriota bacterium]MBV9435193.1 rhomboid family intramembrane serine protease [Acidobacteriota bacterium]